MALAVFDVSKAIGEDGKIIEPAVEFTSGTIRYVFVFFPRLFNSAWLTYTCSHPKPFKCSIKPRSAKAEALILSVDEQR